MQSWVPVFIVDIFLPPSVPLLRRTLSVFRITVKYIGPLFLPIYASVGYLTFASSWKHRIVLISGELARFDFLSFLAVIDFSDLNSVVNLVLER